MHWHSSFCEICLEGEIKVEHFITEIKINELRHLSNLTISLNSENRQNLLITGKNGSGKTSLLLALQKYLQSVNDGQFMTLIHYEIPNLLKAKSILDGNLAGEERFEAEQNYLERLVQVQRYQDGVDIVFNYSEDLESLYMQGGFITAFFPADRKTHIARADGAENIKLEYHYDINANPGRLLHKYMVHLKTQQSYARNEGDMENVDRIQKWFDRFVDALRILLDDSTITLEYDYKEYNFKIHEHGRKPFGFDMLSDGYSSLIHIVSDIILRMEQNWLLGNSLSKYDVEGIVLIDELETHLHIGLQKKIMPFLTKFFPGIQFIVTTHSPYILNSVSNAKAYDLERHMELQNLSIYSSDGLAEGYFEADGYSDELKEKFKRYKHLKGIDGLSEAERAERAKLRSELKNIPGELFMEAKDEFEIIEGVHL